MSWIDRSLTLLEALINQQTFLNREHRGKDENEIKTPPMRNHVGDEHISKIFAPEGTHRDHIWGTTSLWRPMGHYS